MFKCFCYFQFRRQDEGIKTIFIYESMPADLTRLVDEIAFSILRINIFS